MKINKVENKYSHVIKKDDLIELEKILKEFSFTDFAYMVNLADGAKCKYKSVDELFELNNIEKKRILKLEIECYASALDARNCHICIFRNRRFVGEPVEYQYSFPTEKDNVYFKTKLSDFFSEHQINQHYWICLLISYVTIAAVTTYLYYELKKYVMPKETLLVMCGVFFFISFVVITPLFEFLEIGCIFAWRQELSNYEKMHERERNFVWSLLIALIIALFVNFL